MLVVPAVLSVKMMSGERCEFVILIVVVLQPCSVHAENKQICLGIILYLKPVTVTVHEESIL